MAFNPFDMFPPNAKKKQQQHKTASFVSCTETITSQLVDQVCFVKGGNKGFTSYLLLFHGANKYTSLCVAETFPRSKVMLGPDVCTTKFNTLIEMTDISLASGCEVH